MDYKEALKLYGVKKNYSEKEIRDIHRILVKRYHPDLNPGNKNAEEMMKRINNAFDILLESLDLDIDTSKTHLNRNIEFDAYIRKLVGIIRDDFEEFASFDIIFSNNKVDNEVLSLFSAFHSSVEAIISKYISELHHVGYNDFEEVECIVEELSLEFYRKFNRFKDSLVIKINKDIKTFNVDQKGLNYQKILSTDKLYECFTCYNEINDKITEFINAKCSQKIEESISWIIEGTSKRKFYDELKDKIEIEANRCRKACLTDPKNVDYYTNELIFNIDVIFNTNMAYIIDKYNRIDSLVSLLGQIDQNGRKEEKYIRLIEEINNIKSIVDNKIFNDKFNELSNKVNEYVSEYRTNVTEKEFYRNVLLTYRIIDDKNSRIIDTPETKNERLLLCSIAQYIEHNMLLMCDFELFKRITFKNIDEDYKIILNILSRLNFVSKNGYLNKNNMSKFYLFNDINGSKINFNTYDTNGERLKNSQLTSEEFMGDMLSIDLFFMFASTSLRIQDGKNILLSLGNISLIYDNNEFKFINIPLSKVNTLSDMNEDINILDISKIKESFITQMFLKRNKVYEQKTRESENEFDEIYNKIIEEENYYSK